MNIAIFNTLAKSDSTGKIAFGYQSFLKKKGHNAYIFYGRNDELVKDKESDIIRVGNNFDLMCHALCSRISGLQGVYSRTATKKVIAIMDKLKIDAVCMFNLHGYYINMPLLFDYIGKKTLSCEYVMLDEYPFLGKCTYSFDCNKFRSICKNCPQVKEYPKSIALDRSAYMLGLKKKIYDNVPSCVFVGIEYTVNRAKESAIMKGRQFAIADEAIDLHNMYYPRDCSELRKKLRIPKSNTVIVTVSPYPNERKGGKYFLQAARRLESNRSISFVHVGFVGDTSECPSNYIPIGYIKDQNLLCEYYSLGDLFVHTSMAETIPAAIIEALACGTPVLGFNISGIPFSADRERGTFVKPGNVDELVNYIENVQRKTPEKINSCRKYAENRYDSNLYYSRLLSFLEETKS